MAGGRPLRPSPTSVGPFFGYKVFVSAFLSLLFIVAFSVLLASKSHPFAAVVRRSAAAEGGDSPDRNFIGVIQSDPLRARFELIYRQAADHSALAAAYAAYARRLKLDAARQLRIFEDLSAELTEISARVAKPGATAMDEDALRSLEKEARDRIKYTRQLVSESKESFDTQIKIQKLRDTIFSVQEQLQRARKLGALAGTIAAGSTPKSLHCLAMRLVEDRIARPEAYTARIHGRHADLAAVTNPDLYHFAIFSNNVIAVSVVVNSAIRNSQDPSKNVFHVVTDPMYVAAMQVWFVRRPPASGARVDVKSAADFTFLNASYSPIVRQIEAGRKDLALLDYLRFYLPDMFPRLRRIVLLEDDVVVQKDLTRLWWADLDGRVHGAVDMCFGGFRRYSRYLNFSNPVIREKFSPRACAWAYGVNVFDLHAWRWERCTQQFHHLLSLNEDGTLWNSGTALPAGLVTFYATTKPLDKSWHVMGLGYNPSISSDEIRDAAVIHFSGSMKPWLDVALNQYKNLWSKYVDTEMEFLQLCNFGL